MKVLITGGTGLLGRALIASQTAAVDEILATYRAEYVLENSDNLCYSNLDIRDEAGYLNLFARFSPDIVIHTASVGSPDFAEKNKELTWDINVNGTKNICLLCKRFKAKLIHISSNGIYDGCNAPYGEADTARPVNFYGTTKHESENIVKQSEVIHAVVRPTLMYGWPNDFERGNIVSIAIQKLRSNQQLFVYEDVFSNPLFVDSCAQAIWTIIAKEQFDIFNIAGAERASIYSLIKKSAEVFDLDAELVKPVTQGFFNEFVKRPRDTTYKTAKMQNMLQLAPLTLEEGLHRMKITCSNL